MWIVQTNIITKIEREEKHDKGKNRKLVEIKTSVSNRFD
jgi:hypothetical protein